MGEIGYIYKVRIPPPISNVRNEALDWLMLTDWEKAGVRAYLGHECAFNLVLHRGQVFIRRYKEQK